MEWIKSLNRKKWFLSKGDSIIISPNVFSIEPARKLRRNCGKFYWRKCIWKRRLQKSDYFVRASVCLARRPCLDYTIFIVHTHVSYATMIKISKTVLEPVSQFASLLRNSDRTTHTIQAEYWNRELWRSTGSGTVHPSCLLVRKHKYAGKPVAEHYTVFGGNGQLDYLCWGFFYDIR